MARRVRPEYEERLILFIDFLAFKDLVAETARDEAKLARLLNALDVIGEIANSDEFKSKRITQFSDSVVLSYSTQEKSGAFWLLNSIALTVIRLAEFGYLLRGAVTVGKLHHSKNYVVGPAMVEAYEMESKTAKYPRVIINPKILELARRWRAEHHTPKEEEDYVRSYMTKDEDGRYFFDYISWKSVVEIAGGSDDGYGEYLAGISQMIGKGLAHPAPGVREKYLWMHKFYVKVVEGVCALPASSPYRAQSPDVCATIEALPRYYDLAAEAADQA